MTYFYRHVCKQYFKNEIVKKYTSYISLLKNNYILNNKETQHPKLSPQKFRNKLSCNNDLSYSQHAQLFSPLNKKRKKGNVKIMTHIKNVDKNVIQDQDNMKSKRNKEYKFEKYLFINNYLKEKFIKLDNVTNILDIIYNIIYPEKKNWEHINDNIKHSINDLYILQHNEQPSNKLKLKYEYYIKEMKCIFNILNKYYKMYDTEEKCHTSYYTYDRNKNKMCNKKTNFLHIHNINTCYENFCRFKNTILYNEQIKFLFCFHSLYFPLKNLLFISFINLFYHKNIERNIVKDHFYRNVLKNEMDVIYVSISNLNFMKNTPHHNKKHGVVMYEKVIICNKQKTYDNYQRNNNKNDDDNNNDDDDNNNNNNNNNNIYNNNYYYDNNLFLSYLHLYEKNSISLYKKNLKLFDNFNLTHINFINVLFNFIFYENIYLINLYLYYIYLIYNIQTQKKHQLFCNNKCLNRTHYKEEQYNYCGVVRDENNIIIKNKIRSNTDLNNYQNIINNKIYKSINKNKEIISSPNNMPYINLDSTKKGSLHKNGFYLISNDNKNKKYYSLDKEQMVHINMMNLFYSYNYFNFKNIFFYITINREDLYLNKCLMSSNKKLKINLYRNDEQI
ncbi:hypothetical protein PFUGPA_01018 [Plasmodium falciparum Palo Alto/Uganda]|uniref:Uncharacterized protein n=1 Tax=Plasmodium falciparum (isolate Palo Alto / Uganda) TaxID=57270 RepID=W4J4P8_PLAFP|nr:hypothetical protein PFUGPA_01018 [Plasmodium falciparum Palo Alto/Uganda]